MKRWQSILLTIGLSAGMAGTEFIPGTKDSPYKLMAQSAIAAVAAMVAKKASESNPDGTNAKTAWKPEEK
jgi:hypothetical protein